VDFQLQYTPAQQAFRTEVKAWMEANAVMPAELGKLPMDEMATTREQWNWCRGFTQRLGHQGWLYPTLPKQYGGGGLTRDEAVIIAEEMSNYDVKVTTGAGNISTPGLMVYGTETQKQEFLKPLLQGDTYAWQVWTEPDAGVDLASIKTRAVKDGDDFIFNGNKMFISGLFEPEWMTVLAVTDPDAPRHANLGQFWIPANLPGITWENQDLINNGGQHFVHFDDVRVSRKYLIGGETQGWRVTQSGLEIEHGAAGNTAYQGVVTFDVMDAWRRGELSSLAHGEAAREHMVTAYMRANINRLLSTRNSWMFHSRIEQTYEGSQSLLNGRETRIRTAEHMLDLLGQHALISDTRFPLAEALEHGQRIGLMATHAAGSYEIDKVIISRRIGLSRTKDVAAPTQQSVAQ
jgi:alkylation response protein AidB-like acyl-CoA dehydrogenase